MLIYKIIDFKKVIVTNTKKLTQKFIISAPFIKGYGEVNSV